MAYGVLRWGLPLGLAILAMAARAEAAKACSPVVGELVSAEGEVEVQRADDTRWQRAELGESLCQRDTVRVGMQSRGAIALISNAILRLDENTTLHLLDIKVEAQ